MDSLNKGRGAQKKLINPYDKQYFKREFYEAIDLDDNENSATSYFFEHPKTIVNKVISPDIGLSHSINPYQGCEHGCIYCYARNSHTYWGFGAGIDFETKIIAKPDAPALLEDYFKKKNYKVEPIMLSGNTDCYQPLEKKLKITRSLLEVMLRYRHPVGIITKNSLILRDLDLLKELNKHHLIKVAVSLNSLNEQNRRKVEPRTATAKKRLHTMETLVQAGIPVMVMVAPVIPGLTDYEIPRIIKECATRGIDLAGYIMVRLNGQNAELFKDWAAKAFPDKAEKILSLISQCHAGKINDSEFGRRMKGAGPVAESIKQLFISSTRKYMGTPKMHTYNLTAFRNPEKNQISLFGN